MQEPASLFVSLFVCLFVGDLFRRPNLFRQAKKSVCLFVCLFVCNRFLRPDLFRRPVPNSIHKVVTHSGKVVYTNSKLRLSLLLLLFFMSRKKFVYDLFQ